MRLTDMGVAVERLSAAIASRERIAVHGDYDVDGGHGHGHRPPGHRDARRRRRALRTRTRVRDGYGLNTPAIERLHAEGVRVIVSVDCGIRAPRRPRGARDRRRFVGPRITTSPATTPDAVAVANPKRKVCPYPDKDLAGAGVALKLVQALCARAGRSGWLPAFIKIAALGTLADVVPLLGENRVIASLGLEALSRGPHKVGLRALIESAGLAGKAIDSYHVAFMLAPRMNAAGRMSTPDIALRLLLASGNEMAQEARELAAELNTENLRRQQEERSVLAEARRLVENDPDVGSRYVLVVAGEGWHRVVIGIVASRLVDAFRKPAVVLSVEGATAHGSCRSFPAFDMLEALEFSAAHLQQFGGHRAAAGLTWSAAGIKAFREAIAGWAEDRLSPGTTCVPGCGIDAPLGFARSRPA